MAAKKASPKKKASGKKKTPRARGNGPGLGPGYGGPAKGAGNGEPGKWVVGAGPGRGHLSFAGAEREKRIIELQVHLQHLAYHSDTDATQVQATVHLLNRLAGLPIATTVMVQNTTDADDERAKVQAYRESVVADALSARPERVGDRSASPVQTDAGEAPPPDPPTP